MDGFMSLETCYFIDELIMPAVQVSIAALAIWAAVRFMGRRPKSRRTPP